MSGIDELPQAGALPPPRRYWAYVWMLPALALLFAGWLLTDLWRARGPSLTLYFQHGHGLRPGDELRYRGIAVGEVESLRLERGLQRVRAQLRLSPEAADLARAGSRFWIVRPQLDLTGARGLDTVIGANYIGVLPGDADAPPRFEFIALQRPPPLDSIEPGGLEIVLTAPGKGSLKPGAPISYRQVIVGSVITVDLARDATAVEAGAYIQPDYANLIRRDVRFWRSHGARVSAGLDGLSVAVDSVHSLILGGINLAIPPRPGPRVDSGARFALHDRPQTEWLEWTPGLSLYDRRHDDTRRPQLVPATRRWRYRNWLYMTEDGERRAWLLPREQGLLGPADVLTAPEQALEDSARLSIDGKLIPLPRPQTLSAAPGLATLRYPHPYPVWPAARQRTIERPEDSLAIAAGDLAPRFIGADRFLVEEGADKEDGADGAATALDPWPLDPTLPFGPDWHGAAVVAESDGALLGLLLTDADGARLVRLPPEDSLERSSDQ